MLPLACRACTSQLLASKLIRKMDWMNGSERDVVSCCCHHEERLYRDYYTSRRTQTHQQDKYHDSHSKARVEAKLPAASRLHQAHSFAMFVERCSPKNPRGSHAQKEDVHWLMSRSGQSGHGFCATSIWSSIGHIPRVFLTPWMPAALCAMRPLGSYWCACEGSLRGGDNLTIALGGVIQIIS